MLVQMMMRTVLMTASLIISIPSFQMMVFLLKLHNFDRTDRKTSLTYYGDSQTDKC